MFDDKSLQAKKSLSETLNTAQTTSDSTSVFCGFEMSAQNVGQSEYFVSPLAPKKKIGQSAAGGGDTLVALPALRVGF